MFAVSLIALCKTLDGAVISADRLSVIEPIAAADYVCKSLTPFRIFLYMVDLSSFTGLARMEKAENTFRPILLLLLIMPLKSYPTIARFD